MPRIARIVAVGYPHHIVQRGNNKQCIFLNENDKKKYLYLLKKYSAECFCRVHVYCLMYNHVHILAVPQQNTSLAKMMQKLSLTYTQYINQKYNRTGRLWECRFYSAIVGKDRYLLSVCRYIEQNPIRAKNIDSAIDYKWSSARANVILGEKSFIRPVCDEYDIDRGDYRRSLDLACDDSEIGLIRKSTINGIPIGTKAFVSNISKSFGIDIIPKHRGRPRKNKK